MGDGSSGSPSTSGPITIATSTVNSTRGVTEDLYGNVYVADTVNYILREESGGIVTNLTSTNSGIGKVFVSGSSAANALLGEPEDVHVDSYGNIYIVDFSNKLLEAIYKGGTLPNVPVTGLNNIYTIAGGATATPSVDTTPVNGIYPTVAANTVGITMRKISLDPLNNVYITDYSNNVIWFLDHATGYMRILAGNYGSSTPHGGCAAPLNSLGDGCPGEQAAFNLASSNSGIGADADGQGNLYITDPEGSGNSAGSRIRKLLSGLNFPATATGTPGSPKAWTSTSPPMTHPRRRCLHAHRQRVRDSTSASVLHRQRRHHRRLHPARHLHTHRRRPGQCNPQGHLHRRRHGQLRPYRYRHRRCHRLRSRQHSQYCDHQ